MFDARLGSNEKRITYVAKDLSNPRSLIPKPFVARSIRVGGTNLFVHFAALLLRPHQYNRNNTIHPHPVRLRNGRNG